MPGLTPTGISQNHKCKSFEINSNGGRSKFIWWALNETLIKKKKKSKKKKKNISCTRQAKDHIKKSRWHDGGKKCNDPDPHLRDWITSIQAKSKRRSLAQRT